MAANRQADPTQSRLLLVEDDESLAQTLAEILRDEGFAVVICSNATDTLTCLEQDSFEVMVVDLHLPDMDEQGFLQKIGDHFKTTSTIINTGFSSFETAKMALNLGAFAYVEKAGNLQDLLRHVHRAVEHRLRSHSQALTQELILRDHAMATCSEGITMTDVRQPDHPVIFVNDGFLAMTGYQREEVLGRNMRFLQGKVTDPGAVAQLREALAQEQAMTVELQNVRKDGSWFWNRVALSPVRNGDGELTHFIAVHSNVTERRLTEAKQKENQANLSALIENTEDIIWSVDKNCRLILSNSSFDKLLQASHGRPLVPGDNVLTDDFPPDALAQWRSNYDRALKGETVYVDSHQFIRDPSQFIEYRFNPIRKEDGTIQGVTVFGHDVTERKQIESELREGLKREQFLGDIVRDVSVAIGIGFPDGRLQACNPAFVRLTGYTEEELKQLDWNQTLTPEEWRSHEAEHLQKLNPTNNMVRYEKEYIRKDGTRVPIELLVAARFNTEGHPDNFIGFISDITDRQQVKTALRKSETRYRELFENMSSGVAVYEVVDNGKDFIFKDYNQAGEKMDGQLRHQLIGRSIFEVRPGAEEFGLIDAFRRALKTSQPVHHPVALYQDNQISGWYDNYIHVLPSGELVAVFDNVTEKKQAEEILKVQKYYLEKAQEIGQIGTWEFDVQGNTLKWTEENYRIFGVPIGTELNYEIFLNGVHPEDRDYVHAKWSAALNHEPYDIEHRLIVDGKVKWVREKADLDFDENGHAIKAIGVTQDITHRKLVEEKMTSYQSQLKSLTSELTLAEERLKNNIAIHLHDNVQQSLVMLRVEIGLLEREMAEHETQESLHQMYDKVGEILRETQNLTSQLSFPTLALHGLEEAIRQWSEQEIQRKHNLYVSIRTDEQDKPLSDDVQAVLFRGSRELLMNVVKHAQASTVKIDISRIEDSIRIQVQDDGMGLADHEQSNPERTGFGLLSVAEALERLGGSLRHVSQSNQGCTAILVAPLNLNAQEVLQGQEELS